MNQLKRGLKTRHILFLALGSAIGTGLFYGSGQAIMLAGPAVILAYIIAGFAVYMVMRALGEMAVHNPTTGSFGQYATENLGPLAGFVTGWTFVLEMVLVCIADITAFGKYMQFWFTSSPQWIWTLIIVLIICAINLCQVKFFGETEFWLSLIKIVAILAMIIGGAILLFKGVTINSSQIESGFQNLWKNEGFMPYGIGGVIAALSVVVFAYGGVEIIGITAGEATQPELALPKAINTIILRILFFYVLTITILMALAPWKSFSNQASPFVQIFSSLGLQSAANLFNFVVISASVSAINSDIFAAGRMMFGLAKQKQGLPILLRTWKNGVPWATVCILGTCLLGGVLLNYLMPEKIFLFIASIATFATVWVWLMIILSQIKFRTKLNPQERAQLKYKTLFWPTGPILTAVFLVFILAALSYFEATRDAIIAGVLWLIFVTCVYFAIPKKSAQVKAYQINNTLS